jgi:hypothetical protein
MTIWKEFEAQKRPRLPSQADEALALSVHRQYTSGLFPSRRTHHPWIALGHLPCFSILFAGPLKVHFKPEIASLSHDLKSSFLSALPQQPGGHKHANTHSVGALPQELLIYLCPLSYENLQACPIAHTVTGDNLLCYQRPGIHGIQGDHVKG